MTYQILIKPVSDLNNLVIFALKGSVSPPAIPMAKATMNHLPHHLVPVLVDGGPVGRAGRDPRYLKVSDSLAF